MKDLITIIKSLLPNAEIHKEEASVIFRTKLITVTIRPLVQYTLPCSTSGHSTADLQGNPLKVVTALYYNNITVGKIFIGQWTYIAVGNYRISVNS